MKFNFKIQQKIKIKNNTTKKLKKGLKKKNNPKKKKTNINF